MNNKKMLNNNAIAILLIFNIFISLIALINSSKPSEVAYANENDSDNSVKLVEEDKRNKENDNEEDFEVEAVWKVEDVDNHAEVLGSKTMKLYYQHGNEEGAWFTARETNSPNEIKADWYIDSKTLRKANIEVEFLAHNESVEVVYVINDYDEYFEIVAVK